MAETKTAAKVKDEVATTTKKYELYKAKGVYKFKVNEDTGISEKVFVKVEKLSDKPISTHHMDAHHADSLNTQVDNSGMYYFEA